MEVISKIETCNNGAKFYRADLHIHSYGGSHDVKDSSMTPINIVNTSLSEKLDIISVTDHNEINNVEETINAAAGKSILVIPGIELSTPDGHLLVYFSSLDILKKFYASIDTVDNNTQNSRCQTSMLECIKKAGNLFGFSILAHVDGKGGLEVLNPGYSQHKQDILCEKALLGIELKSATSEISYSDSDKEINRRNIGKKRIEILSGGAKQYIARTLFSDSHSLEALGKNAEGKRKLTRIKIDTPTFDAIKLALRDADARIRLEDEIPKSFPYIKGVTIEGGFLDSEIIHLSKNLNCIIGGRGAGKSTAFEAIRCLSPESGESKLIDSEVWPYMINLIWSDEVGNNHLLCRRIGNSIQNLDDPEFGLTEFPIESYGQSETAQISQKAQTDPLALLEYLDKFIDIKKEKIELNNLRNNLLDNQTVIQDAELKVKQIPDFKKALATTKQKLKTLEKAEATEIIKLQRKISEEKSIREQVNNKIINIKQSLSFASTKDTLKEIKELTILDELEVGKEEYDSILTLTNGFEESISGSEDKIIKNLDTFEKDTQKEITKWKKKEDKKLELIDTKKKELEKKGIKLDIKFIKKLADDEAKYQRELNDLEKFKKQLKKSNAERKTLLTTVRTTRDKISIIRNSYGTQASNILKDTLSDLTVSLKYINNGYSQEAKEIILDAMGYRTTQVPRISLLTENLTVPKLLEAIEKNDINPINNLSTSDELKPFSLSDARELLDRLKEPDKKFALERCIVEDFPKITVTKKIKVDEEAKIISRDFSRLSLGQQQSVLLALMLSSDSTYPLIIDQPEDNLDGEFIYHSLVPVLRRAKERRQIIVVTHNPNIAVLGDAELIIAFKSFSDHGQIVQRGSIDNNDVKKVACQILEGAEDAFIRRAEIYGI